MTTNDPAIYSNENEPVSSENPESTCSVITKDGNIYSNDQGPATLDTKTFFEKEIQSLIEKKFNDLQMATREAHNNFKSDLKTEFVNIQETVSASRKGLGKLEDAFNKGQDKMKALTTQLEKFQIHSKGRADFFRSGGCFILLAVKMILVIAVVVFFSTSTHVSEVKPCELKTALDSLYLSYTFDPCKHNAIRGMSGQLSTWGIVELSINSITSLFIIFYICISRLEGKVKNVNWIHVLFLLVSLCALTFFAVNLKMYIDFEQKQKEYAPIRSGELQTVLLSWLANHYKTDNISNSDSISKGWNTVFIKYDCCAVREVEGTTNDFDYTPWCTTSGSCQATASQIPKTCCKDVTEDNYENAPATCHASVQPGTVRPGCIGRLNALNNDGVDEWQVCLISTSLLTMLVLQIFEIIIAIGLLILGVIKFKRQ